MELLQQLLSSFLTEQQKQYITPILKLLSDNSFDIKKTLRNLKPEAVAPVIEQFFKMQNKSRTTNVRQSFGTAPISQIADKDIIYVLNRYLGE